MLCTFVLMFSLVLALFLMGGSIVTLLALLFSSLLSLLEWVIVISNLKAVISTAFDGSWSKLPK